HTHRFADCTKRSLLLEQLCSSKLSSFLKIWHPPRSTLFPYTTLFRSTENPSGIRQHYWDLGEDAEDLSADTEGRREAPPRADSGDRKSTRLNSSHQIISYAVFCLKKKKKI